tara:strand:- start:480 stop:857 length:378 start_codon:yes stop_codon:yes gene_type:complete
MLIFIIVLIFITNSIQYYHREYYNIFVDDGTKKITTLFPNIKNKNVNTLNKMFKDINYCDNVDDLKYITENNKYYLEDDYDLYNDYKESFQSYGGIVEETSAFMNIYFLMIGLFIILILYKFNDQ